MSYFKGGGGAEKQKEEEKADYLVEPPLLNEREDQRWSKVSRPHLEVLPQGRTIGQGLQPVEPEVVLFNLPEHEANNLRPQQKGLGQHQATHSCGGPTTAEDLQLHEEDDGGKWRLPLAGQVPDDQRRLPSRCGGDQGGRAGGGGEVRRLHHRL